MNIQLTEKQKNEMMMFIKEFQIFDAKLNLLQAKIDELNKETQIVFDDVDALRKKESEWRKQMQDELGISEKDFLNLCLNILTN